MGRMIPLQTVIAFCANKKGLGRFGATSNIISLGKEREREREREREIEKKKGSYVTIMKLCVVQLYLPAEMVY